MILYHGSNVAIDKIDLNLCKLIKILVEDFT